MKAKHTFNSLFVAIVGVALCVALMFCAMLGGNFDVANAVEDAQAPAIISVCGVPTSATWTNLPVAIVGEEYKAPNGENYKVVATGTAPLAYLAKEYETEEYNCLPKGLHLNSTTGEIYGTPEEAGSRDISITVTNEHGSASIVCAIIIYNESDKPVLTTESLEDGAVGSSYYQEISYTGHYTPYATCTVVDGALPTGLSVYKQGMEILISGTPTEAGTFTFTLSFYNGAGTTTKEYTIKIKNETVKPSLIKNATIINEEDKYSSVSSSGYINVVKGKPVSIQLVASGTNTADNPIKYSLEGTLPEGLTISESGLITGTPADSIETSYGNKYFYSINIDLTNKKANGDTQYSSHSIDVVVWENGHVQSFSILPNTTSVPKGGQRQFTLDWTSIFGDVDTTQVVWQFTNKPSSKETSISNSGLVTVGLDETRTTLYVQAIHTPTGRTSSAIVTVVDHTHTTTAVDATPKTCTTDGNIKHYKCTICEELFADALATQSLTAEAVKVSACHEYGTIIPKQNATCSDKGKEAYYECSACHLLFNSSKVQKTAEELEVAIDESAHKFGTMTSGVSANCAEDGTKAHKDCEYCHKHFDSDGAEITDLTIAKNDNHLTQDVWSKDGSGHWHACTREGCKDNGKLDFATHTKSAEEATETTDIHCTICKYVIESVKGHTHDLKLVVGHAKACYIDGAKTYYVCSEGEHPCGRFFEDGEGNNEIVENIEIWKVIPAGHTFGDWIDEVPATADDFGVKGHKDCYVCSKHFDADSKEIDDLKIDKLAPSDDPTTPDNPTKPDDPTTPDTPVTPDDSDTPDDSNAPTIQPQEDSSLSGGAIAGIVVASVVVGGTGIFALLWFGIKKKSFADLVAVFKSIFAKK